MRDAEQTWVVAVGVIGLIGFAAGAMAAKVPAVDASTGDAVADLLRRRRAVLAGSVASITGAALLLWPLAAVATDPDPDVWTSLAVFSMAVWVFGFGFLALGSLLVIGVVWRGNEGPGPDVSRVLLDINHLAVWSVSAPIGAVSVLATTAVGVQAGLFGAWVIAAATAKVLTVLIEVAGTGRRHGWNAGGWAYGTSGYATVAWFAVVLLSLA